MAVAMGCSLEASAVPMTARKVCREHLAGVTNSAIRATRGHPWVTVPVLSNTMLVIYKYTVHHTVYKLEKSEATIKAYEPPYESPYS